jgi:cell division protein FtsW (lipid II flippase)
MFSTGQIYFAIFFIVAFVATMIFVYRKDLKEMKNQYKGTYLVLLGFLLFIAFLFFIKFYIKK